MHYPDFVNNSTFYHMDSSRSDAEQLLGLAENIKRVHALTSTHYDDFGKLINDYLRSGIEIFQMQTGIVSHITDDLKYIVKDVQTPLEVIQKGDVYELEGTYCREVYETRRTLGFPHVGRIKELQHHPVYENLKLESYISAPIFVQEKLYGTLNFTSLIPREHGFSEHEQDLISMMAQSIGNFILLQEKEEHLKHLNFRMKELVGHVVHDLRNPIGSMLSLADLSVKLNFDEAKMRHSLENIRDVAENSLELVNTILDEAALGTGKVVMEKAFFNLAPTIKETVKNFQFLIEKRHLSVDLHLFEGLDIYGDKRRIHQLFNNLLANAFKYAKHDTSVMIRCEKEADRVVCRIENVKGEKDRTLDQQLFRSVGYGLDIVQEVLRQHDSRLEIKEESDHYRVSFSLPIRGA